MRKTERLSRTKRLVDYILDTSTAMELEEELTAWIAGSGGFRDFADAHRDKIRKKLRGARDHETVRDVRAELRVAQLLLTDRHIELTFEPYGAHGGPDFGVAYRGVRPFNLEVTRLRLDPPSLGGPLLAKLRQLPPSVPNVLLAGIAGTRAEAINIASVISDLRARADQRDEAVFIGRGLAGSREFHQRLLRLGAVVIWCEGADGVARSTSWTNRSARIAVPDRALRACVIALHG